MSFCPPHRNLYTNTIFYLPFPMIKKTILTTFAMLTLGANIISAQVKLQSNNIDDVLKPSMEL